MPICSMHVHSIEFMDPLVFLQRGLRYVNLAHMNWKKSFYVVQILRHTRCTELRQSRLCRPSSGPLKHQIAHLCLRNLTEANGTRRGKCGVFEFTRKHIFLECKPGASVRWRDIGPSLPSPEGVWRSMYSFGFISGLVQEGAPH